MPATYATLDTTAVNAMLATIDNFRAPAPFSRSIITRPMLLQALARMRIVTAVAPF